MTTAAGLALVLLIAVTARAIHHALPAAAGSIVGEVIFAVLLGLALGNTLPAWPALTRAARLSVRKVLPAAIVLLGAGLSFRQVVTIGGRSLGIIVVLMALALVVAHFLGRWAGISGKLATLIGVGTSVCGNSAIGAAAPVIGAADEEVSFAIAANTFVGTVAVFLYPILGRVLSLSDAAFGTWAGTAVNDTSQVVATGFAISETAGRVATTVKLTRNAMMGVVIVGLSLAYSGATSDRSVSLLHRVRKAVPLFVLGFLALALLNTLGVLDQASAALGRDLKDDLWQAAKFLVLVALAGVGLGSRISALRKAGLRPLYVAIATATATSLVSYALIRIFGAAG